MKMQIIKIIKILKKIINLNEKDINNNFPLKNFYLISIIRILFIYKQLIIKFL